MRRSALVFSRWLATVSLAVAGCIGTPSDGFTWASANDGGEGSSGGAVGPQRTPAATSSDGTTAGPDTGADSGQLQESPATTSGTDTGDMGSGSDETAGAQTSLAPQSSTSTTLVPGVEEESSSGSGPDASAAVDCAGRTYACGDGIDNDGDGRVDLDDPECSGPCDDDETSFATGIPGDNVDCKQDCFFDGNSGQSEGCTWDLRCDPSDPGAALGCGYREGNETSGRCRNQTIEQTCIDVCAPLTPPGCDCFGCCTVQGPDGPVDIFLNGSDDCSIDNLEACTTCTSQIEVCGNPCDREGCERCFGERELPEGCEQTVCEFGSPCDDASDCADAEFCFIGCCYPRPQ